MKKAMFFSLTAILLIIAAVAYIQYLDNSFKEQRNSEILKMQISLVDSFVREFESEYIKEILKISSRKALIAATNKATFNKLDFTDLEEIMSGENDILVEDYTTGDLFNQSIKTLSFNLDGSFEYSLIDAEQHEYDKISLTFETYYEFFAFHSSWSATKTITVDFPAYGIKHPYYDAVIDDSWIQNEGCFLDEVMFGVSDCVSDIIPVPLA